MFLKLRGLVFNISDWQEIYCKENFKGKNLWQVCYFYFCSEAHFRNKFDCYKYKLTWKIRLKFKIFFYNFQLSKDLLHDFILGLVGKEQSTLSVQAGSQLVCVGLYLVSLTASQCQRHHLVLAKEEPAQHIVALSCVCVWVAVVSNLKIPREIWKLAFLHNKFQLL